MLSCERSQFLIQVTPTLTPNKVCGYLALTFLFSCCLFCLFPTSAFLLHVTSLCIFTLLHSSRVFFSCSCHFFLPLNCSHQISYVVVSVHLYSSVFSSRASSFLFHTSSLVLFVPSASKRSLTPSLPLTLQTCLSSIKATIRLKLFHGAVSTTRSFFDQEFTPVRARHRHARTLPKNFTPVRSVNTMGARTLSKNLPQCALSTRWTPELYPRTLPSAPNQHDGRQNFTPSMCGLYDAHRNILLMCFFSLLLKTSTRGQVCSPFGLLMS